MLTKKELHPTQNQERFITFTPRKQLFNLTSRPDWLHSKGNK